MPAPAHREGAHPGRAGGQLTKRGYPDDVSTQVLDRLADVGLVDDADFAEQWVRSRRVNAGKGKRALAAELRTKGVDNEVITAALADIDAGAERERAEQLVDDKLRRERLADGTTPSWCVGWSACWPGAATARPWRSTSSRSRWPTNASAGRSSRAVGWRPCCCRPNSPPPSTIQCWKSSGVPPTSSAFIRSPTTTTSTG